MYFLGTPFVEALQKNNDEIANEICIYVESNVTVDFADKVIERKVDGVTDYVFYINGNWMDERLRNYHQKMYQNLTFFTEEYISNRSTKHIAIENEELLSIKITHYFEDWRVNIEQIFDKNYNLIEYRQLYYKTGSRLPFEEKVFFPSSWVIHSEGYSSS